MKKLAKRDIEYLKKTGNYKYPEPGTYWKKPGWFEKIVEGKVYGPGFTPYP